VPWTKAMARADTVWPGRAGLNWAKAVMAAKVPEAGGRCQGSSVGGEDRLI
jgi:hypothetical protein